MSRRKGHSPKRATRKRYISTLFDDRGHPNPQEKWESILPEVKTGRLIRKRRHDTPRLDDVDPNFGEEFDEAKHGQMLKDELNISHLSVHQQNILIAAIKKYWRVFCKESIATPVKDYECEIDTGNAAPVRCRNPTFGLHEMPIIEKLLSSLLNLVW